jgi:hypothetical protein
MKKSLICFLVMFYLIILAKTALSYDYNWSHYKEPYNNTVNVLLNKGSSEASPQTDELRKKVIHCLRRSDAGCWLLDAG